MRKRIDPNLSYFDGTVIYFKRMEDPKEKSAILPILQHMSKSGRGLSEERVSEWIDRIHDAAEEILKQNRIRARTKYPIKLSDLKEKMAVVGQCTREPMFFTPDEAQFEALVEYLVRKGCFLYTGPDAIFHDLAKQMGELKHELKDAEKRFGLTRIATSIYQKGGAMRYMEPLKAILRYVEACERIGEYLSYHELTLEKFLKGGEWEKPLKLWPELKWENAGRYPYKLVVEYCRSLPKEKLKTVKGILKTCSKLSVNFKNDELIRYIASNRKKFLKREIVEGEGKETKSETVLLAREFSKLISRKHKPLATRSITPFLDILAHVGEYMKMQKFMRRELTKTEWQRIRKYVGAAGRKGRRTRGYLDELRDFYYLLGEGRRLQFQASAVDVFRLSFLGRPYFLIENIIKHEAGLKKHAKNEKHEKNEKDVPIDYPTLQKLAETISSAPKDDFERCRYTYHTARWYLIAIIQMKAGRTANAEEKDKKPWQPSQMKALEEYKARNFYGDSFRHLKDNLDKKIHARFEKATGICMKLPDANRYA